MYITHGLSFPSERSDAWAVLSDACKKAKGAYWDGCHKIYLAMDDREKSLFESRIAGSWKSSNTPTVELIQTWFNESCPLRFVNATYHDEEKGGTEFVTIIEQGFDLTSEE